MNTRIVAIGSCLLLSSLVACGGDDSGGGGVTDAGMDAGEVQAGAGGNGGKSGSSGAGGSGAISGSGDEGGSGGHAAGSGGSGGAGGASSETLYKVSGSVSGLSGTGLKLKLNAGNELSVTASGDFSFTTKLASGADYAVTVGTQPSSPVQACSVASGSGTINHADVSNVTITCSTATRSVGGTLTGSGSVTVVLKNGSEMLTLNADGNFMFPTAIAQGTSYAVTVQTAPAGRSCTVAQGSGTAGTDNIANVAVSCYADLKLLPKARVGGVLLGWENNGATSYNVYVSTDPGCNWDNAQSCTGADHKDGVTTPYLWTGLSDGTPYYFQVRGLHPNDFVTRSGGVGARPNRAQMNGVVNALVLNQGTAYLGGTFTSIGAYTGTSVPLDTQTGLTTPIPNFPIVSSTAYVVLPDGNNGYYIGGEFTSIGTSDRAHLAHVLPNGSIDETWNPDPNAYVGVLALSGTTLFVGGPFTQIGGQTRPGLAAISTTGTGAALAWTPAPDGLVTALAATSDTLYVGGEFANISSTARRSLAAYPLTNNVPGTIKDFHPDPDVPPMASNRIISMYLGNGKLYVSGYFETIATLSRPRAAAFDAATGALVTGFNPDPDLQVNAFALLDGKLYVAGLFSSIGGQNRAGMAALNPDTGAALADWNPSPDDEVVALAAAGDKVYAGGKFDNIGGAARRGLAAVSTSGTGTASAWNPQPDGDPSAFALTGETLYVLGDTRTYGAESRPKLASFSGATLTNWAPNVTGGEVRALAFAGSTVYAGGNFSSVGGMARQGAAAIDGNGAPTAWNAQINNGGQVFALATDATHVFVGGSFTAAGGGNRANLAGLTLDTGAAASGWTAPVPDDVVRALASDSDKLFVGGEFLNLGATGRMRLAALQSMTGALDTGWNPGANQPVNAILVVKNLDVYVGGEFTQLASTTRNHLGSLDIANGSLQGWDPSLDGNVLGLGFGNNTVFAVGEFGNVGPSVMPTMSVLSRGHLAGFDATARTLETAYPNLNDTGNAVAADDNYLYLGGDFTSVKGLLCSSYYRDAM